GPVYGTIYYDQDNTAYYTNPNGLSVLNTVQFDTGAWNTSNDGLGRLYFTSGDSTIYKGSSTSTWSHSWRTSDDITRCLIAGAGDFYATGNITAYWSDKRLKKNINKISD